MYTSQGHIVVLPLIAKFGVDELVLCNEYQVCEGGEFTLLSNECGALFVLPVYIFLQSTQYNELFRLAVLVAMVAIFALLSVLTFREYCSSSLSSPQRSHLVPDVHGADDNFSCVNHPLPKLSELDPLPPLDSVERLAKLTYPPNSMSTSRVMIFISLIYFN
jgi:hypothetical protein